jgi:hypothetical protein
MNLSDDLHRRADHQLGVVTRRQLLDGGIRRDQVAPGTVVAVRPPGSHPSCPGSAEHSSAPGCRPSVRGPDSWLAGPTALALHGWTEPLSHSPVWVLVPGCHRSRDVSWLSIRRTVFTDERIVERGPLRFSCLPRALVDSAALATDDASCRTLLISGVQRRVVRLDDVAHWVDIRRPNGRARLQRGVQEAAAGAWSVPEADLARLVATSHILPPAWLNPELRDTDGRRLTTPDLWFDDVAMAVMVHSRQFHAGELDWEAPVDQDSDLSAARVVVMGVTPAAIARDPARVRARVEATYTSARRSGLRAPVVANRRIALPAPA